MSEPPEECMQTNGADSRGSTYRLVTERNAKEIGDKQFLQTSLQNSISSSNRYNRFATAFTRQR